jgi:hypothetical protein
MVLNSRLARAAAVMLVALSTATVVAAAAPESKRLVRARDYIADERWAQAIDLLRAAADDPKEPRRDESLYWLAHSLHHSGDSGAAVAAISRLEREYPTSMWVKPGQALRIEIAVRLGRSDVLWWTATRPPTRVTGVPVAVAGPSVPAAGPTPVPAPKAGPPPPAPGKPVTMPTSAKPPRPAPPSTMWYATEIDPDPDLRVQALGGLMRTNAELAIPMLAEIAMQHDKPRTATRAVIVLAQSRLPEARATMLEVAKTAPEPVQIYAVRALAGIGGRQASSDLMQVYVTAKEPVKWQIAKSLGDLEQPAPLLQIIRSEKEGRIRSTALIALGRAGAVDQLAALYPTADVASKRSIIEGFVSARAEAQLIRVCDIERKGNPELRQVALERLKLFDTDQAREYLRREPLQRSREKR